VTGLNVERAGETRMYGTEFSGNTLGIKLDTFAFNGRYFGVRMEGNTEHINLTPSSAIGNVFLFPTLSTPTTVGTFDLTQTNVILRQDNGDVNAVSGMGSMIFNQLKSTGQVDGSTAFFTGIVTFSEEVRLPNNKSVRGLNTDTATYHNLIGLTQGSPTNQVGVGDGSRELYLLTTDISSGAAQKVTVDANDSCGAGFRCLRVPN